ADPRLHYLKKSPTPRSTLFPYTTLFRSSASASREKVTHSAHASRPNRTSARRDTCTHVRGQSHDVAQGDEAGRAIATSAASPARSEEHTSELQSRFDLVCRLLLEKKKNM